MFHDGCWRVERSRQTVAGCQRSLLFLAKWSVFRCASSLFKCVVVDIAAAKWGVGGVEGGGELNGRQKQSWLRTKTEAERDRHKDSLIQRQKTDAKRQA